MLGREACRTAGENVTATKHGFESRWGHQVNIAGFLLVSRNVRVRAVTAESREIPPNHPPKWQQNGSGFGRPQADVGRRPLRPRRHKGAAQRARCATTGGSTPSQCRTRLHGRAEARDDRAALVEVLAAAHEL